MYCLGVLCDVRKEVPIEQRSCDRRSFVYYPWSYLKKSSISVHELMYHDCGQVSDCRNGMLRHEYTRKCAAIFSSQNVVRAIAMGFWRALFSGLIDLYCSFFVTSLLLPYTFKLLYFLQRRKLWSMRLYLCVCLSPFSTSDTVDPIPETWHGCYMPGEDPNALLTVSCSRWY